MNWIEIGILLAMGWGTIAFIVMYWKQILMIGAAAIVLIIIVVSINEENLKRTQDMIFPPSA